MVLGTIVIFCTGSESFWRALTSACPTRGKIRYVALPDSYAVFLFFTNQYHFDSLKEVFLRYCILPCLTALIAASLIILARSEPTAPEVASAISSRSLSHPYAHLGMYFQHLYTSLQIGRSTMIRRSKRPGLRRAGSRISGRFVAARSNSPLFVSNPSISASNWFRVCSRSSLPPTDYHGSYR